MSEHEPVNENEIANQELILLARELGFESTTELEQIEKEIVENAFNMEKLPELFSRWIEASESKHPGGQGTQEVKTEIANLLMRARLYGLVGLGGEARDNISDAKWMADCHHLEEISKRLKKFLGTASE